MSVAREGQSPVECTWFEIALALRQTPLTINDLQPVGPYWKLRIRYSKLLYNQAFVKNAGHAHVIVMS
jgi:hypothetical protein